MIGHEQIIAMRLHEKKRPKHVFATFETPLFPNCEIDHYDTCNVYLDGSNPQNEDLRWAVGLDIQLLQCKDMDLWVKWWCAFVDAKPKSLIGIDPDGEVNVYTRR